MDDVLQSWLEQAAAGPGILAGGVRQNEQSVVVKSCHPEFSEPQIIEVIQGIAEAVHSLQQNRIATGYLRWTFDKALLHCATAGNGALAVLLTHKEEEHASAAGHLILEFLQMTS